MGRKEDAIQRLVGMTPVKKKEMTNMYYPHVLGPKLWLVPLPGNAAYLTDAIYRRSEYVLYFSFYVEFPTPIPSPRTLNK